MKVQYIGPTYLIHLFLHPTSFDGSPITVQVNNTHLLDRPSTRATIIQTARHKALACINAPYVLLSRRINVTYINGDQFNVTCNNCNLSNRITTVSDGTSVMAVSYTHLTLPTNSLV